MSLAFKIFVTGLVMWGLGIMGAHMADKTAPTTYRVIVLLLWFGGLATAVAGGLLGLWS